MEAGFPEVNSSGARSRFDREAAKFLAGYPALRSGESLRDDVWACLATVFLPDVVRWRFEGCPRDRYLGGVRNAFQRLWVRGVVLDRGEGSADRWQLVDHLTEDAMVQIFERSSISGNPVLARGIAEAWLKTRDRVPAGEMESLMRQATKIIRLRNEIYAYAVIPSELVLDELLKVFSWVSQDIDTKSNVIPAEGESHVESVDAREEKQGRSLLGRLRKYLPGAGKH